MDKLKLEELIREAYERIENGSACIKRQRQLLDQCEAEGLDLPTARQFLKILMEAQKLHVADLEVWQRKLTNQHDMKKRTLFRF